MTQDSALLTKPPATGSFTRPVRKLTLEDRLLRKLPYWQKIDALDLRITNWMGTYGLVLMRVGLGIVFFWFGALKLIPGMSPAEELVRQSTWFVNPAWFLPLLAIWEVVIGIGLITGLFMRTTLLLLFLQMPGTLLPIVMVPHLVFTRFPFGLTIEGQYIMKNLALVTAALVLGAAVRGGRFVNAE